MIIINEKKIKLIKNKNKNFIIKIMKNYFNK